MSKPIWGGKRKGAGRPKTNSPNVVTLSICLKPDLKTQIDKAVEQINENSPNEKKICRSDFIVEAIEKNLSDRRI